MCVPSGKRRHSFYNQKRLNPVTDTLLLQLPIPQINFGLKTGNIPLAAACLKQAASLSLLDEVCILPESITSYLGDAALLERICAEKPKVVGFSVYAWNVDRSLYLARKLKESCSPRIVFGGPEITSDNPIILDNSVDFTVCGPGESALVDLLMGPPSRRTAVNAQSSDLIFQESRSPYLAGLLEPGIDDMVYLETQRGCPYRCGFCYYNKSRKKMSHIPDSRVLEAVHWTRENNISELCLLDPSLNIRPGLTELLKKMATVNRNRCVALNAETRAEQITVEMADLFGAAGFAGFEIGLQSTNEKALAAMQRKTDLKRFLRGVNLLKERDILPRIDLIVGLPGDSPDGFRRSLQFVIENELFDDVQVFPLSVLPGTDFRNRHRELGLAFHEDPPYTIRQTPSFSSEDIFQAFEESEHLLDVALFPAPHLNISLYAIDGKQTRIGDHTVRAGDVDAVLRLMVNRGRPLGEIESLSRRLAHPYQLVFLPGVESFDYMRKVISLTSEANPCTPFEVIFLEPSSKPNTAELITSVCLKRPHYMDIDQRFAYRRPGNRAVLFTVVTTDTRKFFEGEMERQAFWWRAPRLPSLEEIRSFHHLDGILIDTSRISLPAISEWQLRTAPLADELPYISFADAGVQKQWLARTMASDYWLSILPFS